MSPLLLSLLLARVADPLDLISLSTSLVRVILRYRLDYPLPHHITLRASRAVKNLNCSDVEATARDVTSNAVTNASPEDLRQLSQWSFNEYAPPRTD
jgi:hypothetical protein